MLNLGEEKRFWKRAYWTDEVSMPAWVFILLVVGIPVFGFMIYSIFN
jgi:hypothetical protein